MMATCEHPTAYIRLRLRLLDYENHGGYEVGHVKYRGKIRRVERPAHRIAWFFP